MSDQTSGTGAVCLPRYFAGRGEARRTTGRAIHVIDHLRLVCPGGTGQEIVVCLDGEGGMHAVEEPDLGALDPDLKQALANGELVRGRPPWTISARQLYFFTFTTASHRRTSTRPEEPVVLGGTLHGPVPPSGRLDSVEGELTVAWSEFLEGFVRGGAFPYQPAAGGCVPQDRCWHAVLPAGRAEEVAAGSGLVVAYPMDTSDLVVMGPSNESLARYMLYDALTGLKKDFERQGSFNPLRNALIPVPSRRGLESEMRAKGFTVDGDQVLPDRRAFPTNVGKMVASLSSALGFGRKPLPPEGAVEDYLTLCAQSLAALPGFPSARITQLRTSLAVQLGLRTASLAAQAKPAAAPPPRRPTLQPQSAPGDWMHDFERPAARNGRDAPRRRDQTRAETNKDLPDWMSDFDDHKPR